MLPVASTKASGAEAHHLPGGPPVPDGGAHRTIGVFEEPEDLALHEHVDLERDGALLQGPDQLQAGAVTDMREARVAVAAEVALEDAAVLGAVEQGPPPLELVDAVGGLLGVQLGHAPVVEHLPAPHGVAEVHLPVVLGPHVSHRRRGATLGHDGVGLAQQGLAHERGALSELTRLDRGAQPRPAGADDDDVVVVGLEIVAGVGHDAAQKIFGSENTPLATSRTYRSANATMARLAHAICMCRALSGVVNFHSR